jgi:hypothetical protein
MEKKNLPNNWKETVFYFGEKKGKRKNTREQLKIRWAKFFGLY